MAVRNGDDIVLYIGTTSGSLIFNIINAAGVATIVTIMTNNLYLRINIQ